MAALVGAAQAALSREALADLTDRARKLARRDGERAAAAVADTSPLAGQAEEE